MWRDIGLLNYGLYLILMFFNYLKVSIRSLLKNKVYTFINLIGLSVGLAASIMILFFVSHELSFDRFHANASRIYHVLAKGSFGGMEYSVSSMSAELGPAVTAQVPAVEGYTRLREPGRVVIQADENHRFFESRFIFADPSLFTTFSFHVNQGTSSSLAAPAKVMITAETALRYFGHTNVIGKSLTYNNTYDLEVVGILDPAPSNSTLQYDFVASFSSLGQIEAEKKSYANAEVGAGMYGTYLLLNPQTEIAEVEKSILAIATNQDMTFSLVPLVSSHDTHINDGSWNFGYIKIFTTIALLILVLALFNYINLATARATTRSKEVGVRKVIGANRNSLAHQFFMESTLLTSLAFIIAIGLVQLFTPWLLSLMEQRIDASYFTSPSSMIILAALWVACVAGAGFYPALVLSRFLPVEVLKGKLSGHTSGSWLQKGFSTFQFAASMALIICALVVNDQLSFMRHQKLGLNKEQVMVIPLTREFSSFYSPFKNKLEELIGVNSVGASTLSLYKGGYSIYTAHVPSTNEEIAMPTMFIDNQFAQTMGLTWVSRLSANESNKSLILNESAIPKLKIEGNPLQQQVNLGGRASEIQGVVKDFNFTSLRSSISALAMIVEPDSTLAKNSQGVSLYVRLDPNADIDTKIASIRRVYEDLKTEIPFEYHFLDDAFDKLYRSEDRLATLFGTFAFIGIGLACLGLFGLVTFALERRVKEIGIRKVLGASILQIIRLLSSQFVLLFVTGAIVAVPVAWYWMDKWLTQFAFRTEVQYWVPLLAVLITFAIACLTINVKIWRVAQINPVESLKNE